MYVAWLGAQLSSCALRFLGSRCVVTAAEKSESMAVFVNGCM